MEKSGNAALAGDISVLLSDAFCEAAIVAFCACEDINDPLSLAQKKQVLSACMTVVLDMKNHIEMVLDLDDIARNCATSPDKLQGLFNEIGIDCED